VDLCPVYFPYFCLFGRMATKHRFQAGTHICHLSKKAYVLLHFLCV
jgi:hypothetical protein